jgi:signal peptidase I
MLNEGKTVQVQVYGMSMFPILMPRDNVQIRKVTFEEIEPGQVLVFEREGQWIAHRLIKKDSLTGLLITRGDGLPYHDEPVISNNIKGIITKVIKTRSPFAWSINTRIDRFMVRAAPVTGKIFWYMGRIVSRGIRILKRLILSISLISG